MRRITLICLTLTWALSALPLIESSVLGAETKTLWVAHRRVDCIGVAPQKCYLIKDSQYEDWRFWYGEIEGFDYEEGYAYEIRVLEERIENPPADAAAVQLKLVEVTLKVETFEHPAAEPAVPEPTEPAVAVAAPPEPTPTPAPVPSLEGPTPTPAPAPSLEEPTPTPAPAPAAPSASTGQVFRGHLTIGAGVEARSFSLCGAEESMWVEDRTDADLWGLYRRLSSYPNRPVFMEVKGELTEAPTGGFGAHFQQQILIHEIRDASVESAGCFAEPRQFAFRASGNEPFWNLEISKLGLSFSEMGQDGRTLYPYSSPTFFGEQIIYRSQIRGHSPRTIVVRLEEQPCSDSMGDARFSFSASVRIDDRTLNGCAVEGEAEP